MCLESGGEGSGRKDSGENESGFHRSFYTRLPTPSRRPFRAITHYPASCVVPHSSRVFRTVDTEKKLGIG